MGCGVWGVGWWMKVVGTCLFYCWDDGGEFPGGVRVVARNSASGREGV